MPQRFRIDTSVLLRLVMGEPAADLERCLRALTAVVDGGGEVFVSNQVIGEAYIVLQEFYRASRPAARTALLDVLNRSLLTPLNGPAVMEALEASSGPGLVDRLIVDGYRHHGLETLMLDRRMAGLPQARQL